MPAATPQAGPAWEADTLIPNTLRVRAHARGFMRLRDPRDLPRALDAAQTGRVPLLVLGSGSNVLFARDFPGNVLQMATRGIEDRGGGRVRVAAGESWDAFVRWSLVAGYTGLENLVLIPGTVGAAPVQNIGAYGVELSEFVAAVEVWDRRDAGFSKLPPEACGFAYRDSIFKQAPERYIITSVEFALPRERALSLDYQGVREELDALGIARPSAADVARAVERLRLRKLPDPGAIGNAGSFFKNPVVGARELQRLRERYPDMPCYPQPGGGAKLSAAGMIEQCGLKGVRRGDAGLYAGHALVLVNHGRAKGSELLALAREVRADVIERFGVSLHPEPRILPDDVRWD